MFLHPFIPGIVLSKGFTRFWYPHWFCCYV